MRRKDRETSEPFALAVADQCEYAALSVTDGGRPYCVPVSIARREHTIYFHSAKQGRKVDCLLKNPEVCVVCVGDTRRMENEFSTEFESAILFGRASEVTQDSEKIEALRLICERHTPKNMANFDAEIEKSLWRTAVWRIEVDETTGKRKKYGPDGREIKFGREES